MDFSEIFERIKDNTDIDTLKSLAEVIGCKPQQVSRKNRENKFPTDWAFFIAQKYGLSTDWLLTGEGPKRLGEKVPKINYNFPILTEVDQWLSEVIIGEPGRKEWFRICLEDSFPMFKEWRKKRKDT